MASLKELLINQKPATKELRVAGIPTPLIIAEWTVGRKLAFFETMADNALAIKNHKDDPANHPLVEELDEAMVAFIFSLVDENGDLVFGLSDYDALKAMPYKTIQAVYREMIQLSNAATPHEDIEAEKKG